MKNGVTVIWVAIGNAHKELFSAPADLELYYNDYNKHAYRRQQGIIELLKAVKVLEGSPGGMLTNKYIAVGGKCI